MRRDSRGVSFQLILRALAHDALDARAHVAIEIHGQQLVRVSLQGSVRGALLVIALGQGVEHQLQSISVPSPLGRWQAITAPLLQPCQNGAALDL